MTDTPPRCDVCEERARWFRPVEPVERPATEYRRALPPVPALAFVCDEHRRAPDAVDQPWREATPQNVMGYVQGLAGEGGNT